MATRNFVPRANGEGSIGTSAKKWASGFFQNLAVSAITTAVNVVVPAASANDAQPATTSWVRSQFQSILTGVLQAAGLRYNIAANGYICFGSLFGGLILQWGCWFQLTSTSTTLRFPIQWSGHDAYAFTALPTSPDAKVHYSIGQHNSDTLEINSAISSIRIDWIALGH